MGECCASFANSFSNTSRFSTAQRHTAHFQQQSKQLLQKTPITSQTAATLAVTRPERPHVAADDGRTLSCQLYLPKKVTCCTAAAAATVAVAAACGLVVLAAAAAFCGEGKARYVAASDDPYTAAAVQEYKEAQGVHEIKADADVPAKG